MNDSVLARINGAGSGRGELEFGRVVAGTAAILRSHGLMLLALSMITAGAAAAAPLLFEGEGRRPSILVSLAGVLAALLADQLLVCLATAAALGETGWRRLAKRLPWAVAVGVAAGVGQGLGYLLLIVPGVILTTMWVVAVPVCIAEKPGFTALDRSSALTEGRRWPVVGLLIGYALSAGLFTSILTAIPLPVAGPSSMFDDWVSVGAETIVSVIGAAGVAALYLELRRAAEGPSVESVADIFS